MSLEYYLFCRKRYDDILYNIENILEAYENILEAYENIVLTTLSENILDTSQNDIFNPFHNIHFFIERKKCLTHIRQQYELKINDLCKHTFEDDLIDITPDESKHISYCTVCGFTK